MMKAKEQVAGESCKGKKGDRKKKIKPSARKLRRVQKKKNYDYAYAPPAYIHKQNLKGNVLMIFIN